MNVDVLIEHYEELTARLSQLEGERAQVAKKLKALDVLLEGIDVQAIKRKKGTTMVSGIAEVATVKPHPNAVRVSHRISLIGAVEQVARKMGSAFSSPDLLKAIQVDYPEFGLSETKHISSPLSDLVKKGVLALERKRTGSEPNIYRVVDDTRKE